MRGRNLARGTAALVGACLAVTAAMLPAGAETYQRISGEGSSWAANAIDAMRVNVKQFGITVDYNPSGSSAGRKNFLNGTVDFAASDIPFQLHPEDGSAPERPAPDSYAYIPVTAGGTVFMYNLKINGQRVTNLRLSGENVSKIFTGVITQWNDPAIRADNPGLSLPDRKVVPVVRSDGSGSTAQFTKWLIHQYPDIWAAYCARSGRAPACGFTSFYPTVAGMIAQSGDLGVSGYVAQTFAEGAVGYVNYSYALGARFPVAKVLNAAGYYTEPTPENVAVSLLKAKINYDKSSDDYLTQQLDDVYNDSDQRNYQLSSYSYFILPTTVQGQFTEAKGTTLGAFATYAMCQAQQQSASLGYSPMPINLVQASFDQIRKIPGAEVQGIDIQNCHNPTFSPDGTNLLADNAPMPQPCDKQGDTQCETGTGGAKSIPTPVRPGGTTTPAAPGAAPAPAPDGRAAAGGSAAPAAAAGMATPAADAPAVGAGRGAAAPAGGHGSVADAGAGTGSPACDADTGACGSSAETGPAPAAGSGGPVTARETGSLAVASPTVLRASSGWSGAQNLVAVVVLLTLALVIVPPLAWRHLSSPPRRLR